MEKPKIEEYSYQCSKCESTNIEVALYHPTCVGYIQEDGIKKVVYIDADDTQKVQCFCCGDKGDFNFTSIQYNYLERNSNETHNVDMD